MSHERSEEPEVDAAPVTLGPADLPLGCSAIGQEWRRRDLLACRPRGSVNYDVWPGSVNYDPTILV